MQIQHRVFKRTTINGRDLNSRFQAGIVGCNYTCLYVPEDLSKIYAKNGINGFCVDAQVWFEA